MTVVKGEVEPGKAIVNAHRGVMRYYKKYLLLNQVIR